MRYLKDLQSLKNLIDLVVDLRKIARRVENLERSHFGLFQYSGRDAVDIDGIPATFENDDVEIATLEIINKHLNVECCAENIQPKGSDQGTKKEKGLTESKYFQWLHIH